MSTLAYETDMALAELHIEGEKIRQRLAGNANTLLRLAGAKFYYQGRRLVTDMTVAEAVERVTEAADYIDAYKAEHAYTERSSYTLPSGEVQEYDYHGTRWDDYQAPHGIPAHEADSPAKYLADRDEYITRLDAIAGEAAPLEAIYHEHHWTRFFLVTSSQGHIHSSMQCSTCRPSTTYGWLPELSGKTEAEAVEAHGPALCSVCFASAPVEYQGGKLTKRQAEAAAYR